MLVVLACVLSFNLALGASPEHFNSFFKLKKDDQGKLIAVVAKVAPQKFSLKPFIESLINKIKAEKEILNQNPERVVDYERFIASIQPPQKSDIKFNEKIKKSLEALRTIDINQLRLKLENSKILKEFQSKIDETFLALNPNVVANLESPKFFFSKKLIYQVVEMTLNIIQSRVNDIPLLNTLTYIVSKVEQFITEQREFHQYMLIYYLENYTEEELGITKEEADHIMSSIYESKLGAFDFATSKKMPELWDVYGYDQFYAQVRNANNQLRFGPQYYDELGLRVNYAFHTAKVKGKKLILNLFATQHMFSQKFAVAFNFEKPGQVLMTRLLVYGAQIGLSFVPKVPNFVKQAVNSFLDSVYIGKGSIEGALYAHLMETDQKKFANLILLQNINPYLFIK